jgi:diguanylate cyclase (GGDEF)-like protein
MDGSFAFELPLMHLTFGITFMIAARWGERSAVCFGIAFLCNAAGFGLPVVPAGLSNLTVAWVTDILFAVSFLFFGQAAAEHFRVGRDLFWTRIAIMIASITLCMTAVIGFDNLHIELIASDAGCVLLLGLPLLGVRYKFLHSFDKWLLGASWLVTIESIVRGASSLVTAPADVESFDTSRYAFLMQAMGSVCGVIFAMAGLAAVALSVIARFRGMAMNDPLSGLLNRRGFEEALAGRPELRDPPASIVTCDIDRFKAVNDSFGHDAGDAVIRALGAVIRAHLPKEAIAARFGGEEFILILPAQSSAQTIRIAEALRSAFEAEGGRSAGIRAAVTMSMGVSALAASDFSIHDAIVRADAALYEAKRDGRNRIAVQLFDEIETKALLPGRDHKPEQLFVTVSELGSVASKSSTPSIKYNAR